MFTTENEIIRRSWRQIYWLWDWIPNNHESQLFLLIGRLTTFNFNNNVNSAHLHSQDYAICIRREVGKKWIKSSQFNQITNAKLFQKIAVLNTVYVKNQILSP